MISIQLRSSKILWEIDQKDTFDNEIKNEEEINYIHWKLKFIFDRY